MPPIKHAVLSASSAARWMRCPPSAKINAELPDASTSYAREGTCAHALAEAKVRNLFHLYEKAPISIKALTENLDYYDSEMEACTDAYAECVSEQFEEAKKLCSDPILLVEQHLDFSNYVPQGFGTGDCVIVADKMLQIIDFKYGQTLVQAKRNPQMMLYALGALEAFDGIYDIKTIRMTIFQPRRENIATDEISKEELLRWAKEILQPAAALAAEGKGDFHAGEHCKFCKIKFTCRKRAEYHLSLARYDFAPPNTLDSTEISAILEKAAELVSWANDVKEYALSAALSGTKFAGFKLVAGRSNRRYIDKDTFAKAAETQGINPYTQEVLSITAMEKRIGKKQFAELFSAYVEKPEGAPVLVPESDKREELSTARNDFMEEM